MRRRTWLAMGLVLALVAVGSACGGGDDPPPSADQRPTSTAVSSTTSTSSSTTTTTAPKSGYVKAKVDPSLPRQDIDINLRYPASFTPAQVEVVQAWANYRHVFYVMTDPPAPESPLLDSVATVDVQKSVRDRVRRYQADGIVVRLSTSARVHETVTMVKITADRASLLDCLVDGAAQVRQADGSVVNADVETVWARIYLARDEAGWKVSAPRPETLGTWHGDRGHLCLPNG